MFFDSEEPLVPEDTNGTRDVYEWERDGAGSCREAAGCQYLLSGGTSSSGSMLLDVSANGNDVFMISRAHLVPQDTNEQFNVFDARVGGVSQPVPAACSGAGCQGAPPAPPSFATPSSETFQGVDNFPPVSTPVKQPGAAQLRAARLAKALKACRTKRSKRKRVACESTARRRYGPPGNPKRARRAGRAGTRGKGKR